MVHPPLQHIIWDWNGTLLDDTWLCVELINAILSKRGLPNVDTEAYRTAFGFPVVGYYRTLGFDLEAEPFETLSAEFIASYQERWRSCRLQENARETLEALRRRGFSQSVLSASGQAALDDAVRHFALTEFFLRLIGQGDDFAHGKLESGKHWVAGLDWSPETILLVGDTLHDFEVARDLGVHCVLVDCGHHNRRRLEATGVPVLPGLKEVIPFIESSFRPEPGAPDPGPKEV